MSQRPFQLRTFVSESNRIEGIHRGPTAQELIATEAFLALPVLTVVDVCNLVNVYAPGAALREYEGMNVRVGRHIPPRGGPAIRDRLYSLVDAINAKQCSPYVAHVLYETLHPFMDGNGRSGRAIWLWMMGGIERAPLGFLHHFYYQALDASQPRTPPSAAPRIDPRVPDDIEHLVARAERYGLDPNRIARVRHHAAQLRAAGGQP